MKIFGWVHRKFHNNVLKDKKNDGSRKSSETKALLKQIALVDIHDDWKDGILSIGTFGYEDPLEPFKQESDNFTLTSEEQEVDDQEEQYFSSEYDLNDDIDSFSQEDQLDQLLIHSSEYVPKQDIKGIRTNEIGACNAAATVNACRTEGDVPKKGERVTLADLFMADSNMKENIIGNELINQDVDRSASLTRKNIKSSFVKKLILGGKENSFMKLPKLVKRMLKKKIHPEIGWKGEKKNAQYNPVVPRELLNEEEIEVGESISLLLT